jgi:hypothetical protein
MPRPPRPGLALFGTLGSSRAEGLGPADHSTFRRLTKMCAWRAIICGCLLAIESRTQLFYEHNTEANVRRQVKTPGIFAPPKRLAHVPFRSTTLRTSSTLLPMYMPRVTGHEPRETTLSPRRARRTRRVTRRDTRYEQRATSDETEPLMNADLKAPVLEPRNTRTTRTFSLVGWADSAHAGS